MYMTYKELSAEQEKPLDYKIEKAVEALARGFAVSKHTCALAFSGGKDSTVLWDLIRRFLPEYAEMFYIIYGNTGVCPSAKYLARLHKAGADVIWILTGEKVSAHE